MQFTNMEGRVTLTNSANNENQRHLCNFHVITSGLWIGPLEQNTAINCTQHGSGLVLSSVYCTLIAASASRPGRSQHSTYWDDSTNWEGACAARMVHSYVTIPPTMQLQPLPHPSYHTWGTLPLYQASRITLPKVFWLPLSSMRNEWLGAVG